ncbi:MAG TPA: hypothetical protein VF657_02020 [Actinoplanes sp.]|jgi:hypothetical protein
MNRSWVDLPAPARPIAVAVDDAVTAARRHDPEALAVAVDALAAQDPAQAGLVLGTLVRLLLEDAHPDGLDADDIREVLRRCVRGAAPWQPDVDPHVLLVLLAGALGVLEPDTPSPGPEAAAHHAALLLAELTEGSGRPFTEQLSRAFTEIEQTRLDD